MKNTTNTKKAFTLIELMIVVAIIGILAAVAVPKFADLINKSREGATKGALAGVKSALAVYYSDNEGIYPSGARLTVSTLLTDTLVPKYINEIPKAHIPPYHAASNSVRTHEWPSSHTHDTGSWGYDSNAAGTVTWGAFYIWCMHDDSKGVPWSTF